jgi:hypothetical protein
MHMQYTGRVGRGARVRIKHDQPTLSGGLVDPRLAGVAGEMEHNRQHASELGGRRHSSPLSNGAKFRRVGAAGRCWAGGRAR